MLLPSSPSTRVTYPVEVGEKGAHLESRRHGLISHDDSGKSVVVHEKDKGKYIIVLVYRYSRRGDGRCGEMDG